MVARLFILVFAILAVHGELDSIKRDWQAGSLKWGDE